jgi:hypothetical protein
MQQNPRTINFHKYSVFCALLGLLLPLETNATDLSRQQLANNSASTNNRVASRIITGINTSEDVDSVSVIITCNTKLNYLSANQSPAPGLVLHFPASTFNLGEQKIDLDNSIIDNITTSEHSKRGRASIAISLKQKSPYRINREDGGIIRIDFAKVAETESKATEIIQPEPPTENTLVGVTPQTLQNEFRIFVETSRQIERVKTMTLNRPPRIVLDLYDVKSDRTNGQIKLSIKSAWISHVRYFAHPEKLRVVLDTKTEFLTAFTTESLDHGLLILVGPEIAPR